MKSLWLSWILVIVVTATLAFQLGRIIASHQPGPSLEDSADAGGWSDLWWRQ